MDIPFDIKNIEEQAKEKLENDIIRFLELYIKYRDDINEVLEFTELYNRLVPNIRNKWID